MSRFFAWCNLAAFKNGDNCYVFRSVCLPVRAYLIWYCAMNFGTSYSSLPITFCSVVTQILNYDLFAIFLIRCRHSDKRDIGMQGCIFWLK